MVNSPVFLRAGCLVVWSDAFHSGAGREVYVCVF